MTCSPECWAMPTCTTCGLRKAPRGRSIPLPAAGSYCTWHDCEGYNLDPQPGHLWPGEAIAAPPSEPGGET